VILLVSATPATPCVLILPPPILSPDPVAPPTWCFCRYCTLLDVRVFVTPPFLVAVLCWVYNHWCPLVCTPSPLSLVSHRPCDFTLVAIFYGPPVPLVYLCSLVWGAPLSCVLGLPWSRIWTFPWYWHANILALSLGPYCVDSPNIFGTNPWIMVL